MQTVQAFTSSVNSFPPYICMVGDTHEKNTLPKKQKERTVLFLFKSPNKAAYFFNDNSNNGVI